MSNRENLVETLRRLGPEHVVDGMELCPACDALSPGISTDGETITHCELCRDAVFGHRRGSKPLAAGHAGKIWQQVKPLARLNQKIRPSSA